MAKAHQQNRLVCHLSPESLPTDQRSGVVVWTSFTIILRPLLERKRREPLSAALAVLLLDHCNLQTGNQQSNKLPNLNVPSLRYTSLHFRLNPWKGEGGIQAGKGRSQDQPHSQGMGGNYPQVTCPLCYTSVVGFQISALQCVLA